VQAVPRGPVQTQRQLPLQPQVPDGGYRVAQMWRHVLFVLLSLSSPMSLSLLAASSSMSAARTVVLPAADRGNR